TAGLAFDPIAGDGARARADAERPAGSVNYDLNAKDAFTLLGSPTLIADIESPGPHSQVAARLLDVAPDGRQTLVARGLWRPRTGSARQVFQLHPNGYRFEAGHTARVQLLPADIPYSRPTNGQLPVTFANVEIRLPVRQRPGRVAGVRWPAVPFVPEGYELARGFTTAGPNRGR
ncbi:MAG TPA: CocE/NonD family hydrolase C-terminal non-catalytic domain-containing protein, partial [Solirubrobacterales bacterium]|nr:CocE/NonD family hydrolase C-terminal non-catalytic domain-containing protein [Solirubrobacterales bacterium]